MTEIKPSDYSYRVTKEIEPNPNTGNLDYRVHLIEWDLDYSFERLDEVEEGVEEIIGQLLKTRKKQKIPPPLPLKFEKEFSGQIVLRMSPELHKKLYMESRQTGISINKLIQKKIESAG